MGQLEERFLRLNLVTKVTLLGLAFMLNDLIFYCIVGIEQEKVLTFFLTNTLPECLYTMVFGVFCFLPFTLVFSIFLRFLFNSWRKA